MKLDPLKPLLDHDGPLTTVCLDVTRAEEAGDRELRSRWNGLRKRLEAAGAPSETIDALADVVLRTTHVPGPHGRFVVASGARILYDRVLSGPPTHEEAFHDGVPALMPAAQAEEDAVRYLLVEVDRSGADLTWSGTDTPAPEPDAGHVEGGHDVLHKVRAGGWSHRRMQSRVEDSWERNAEAVAAELDRAVVDHRPELVLITGRPGRRADPGGARPADGRPAGGGPGRFPCGRGQGGRLRRERAPGARGPSGPAPGEDHRPDARGTGPW